MISLIEDFKRRSKIPPVYVPTTPQGLREFLDSKNFQQIREFEWIVCVADDIPIAYFKHVWHEESDDFILQNFKDFMRA